VRINYILPAAGIAQTLQVAGTGQPLPAAGTAQPLQVAGTGQPLQVAGTSQRLQVAGTSQHLPASGIAQHLQVAGIAQRPIVTRMDLHVSQVYAAQFAAMKDRRYRSDIEIEKGGTVSPWLTWVRMALCPVLNTGSTTRVSFTKHRRITMEEVKYLLDEEDDIVHISDSNYPEWTVAFCNHEFYETITHDEARELDDWLCTECEQIQGRINAFKEANGHSVKSLASPNVPDDIFYERLRRRTMTDDGMVTYYGVWCNSNKFAGCKQYKELSNSGSKKDAIQEAKDAKWKLIMGNWYCPTCAKEQNDE